MQFVSIRSYHFAWINKNRTVVGSELIPESSYTVIVKQKISEYYGQTFFICANEERTSAVYLTDIATAYYAKHTAFLN